MTRNDDNPTHDSREGTPVYRGADRPDQAEDRPPRQDDALGQDTTPQHDNREDDQTFQAAPPAGTGSASSFDARHNEFDASEGQAGAGIDKRTGEAVHGDGLLHEQAEEPRPEGFDAVQPRQVEDGQVDESAIEAGQEPNAEQPRERR